MTNVKTQRNDVISEPEMEYLFRRADILYAQPTDIYWKIRTKCVLAIARRTGKRREEIASVEMSDVQIMDNENVSLVFNLEKKRKKERRLMKSPPKIILANDPYRRHIVTYLEWLKINVPSSRYLFPSIKSTFESWEMIPKKHISGRTIYNILHRLSPQIWVHLFRETVGAEEIRRNPDIIAPYRVQRRLDLEDIKSAFAYMRRYAVDVMRFDGLTEEGTVKKKNE